MADSNIYLYRDQWLDREQLERVVSEEAKTLDPEQWFAGKFEFDEWLSDSIVTGDVKRLGPGL